METPKHKKIKLEELPKEVPFSTPDNYFEALPQQVQNRLPQQAAPWWQVLLGWWQQPAYRFSSVAAVLVLAAGLWWLWPGASNTSGGNNTQELLAQVSQEEMLSYLEASNVSVEEVVNTFDLDTEGLEAVAPGTDYGISTESMQQYLENELTLDELEQAAAQDDDIEAWL